MVVHFKVLWHKIAAQNLYSNMENWAKSYSISRPIEWIMVSSLDIAEVHFLSLDKTFLSVFIFVNIFFTVFNVEVFLNSGWMYKIMYFRFAECQEKKEINLFFHCNIHCFFVYFGILAFVLRKREKTSAKNIESIGCLIIPFTLRTLLFSRCFGIWAPTKHWHSPLKRFLYVHFYRQYIDKRFVFLASCSDQQESKNRKMIINRSDR